MEGVDSLLDRLEQYQICALFFFPANDLARYDGEVRRVLCAGHAVGLTLTGTTADEMAASAAEGNRILRKIAYSKTYTVLLPDEAAADINEAIQNSGLLTWETDVDARPNGQNVSAWMNTVFGEIEARTSHAYILSDCSTSAAAMMARLIPELVEDQYSLRLATETEI